MAPRARHGSSKGSGRGRGKDKGRGRGRGRGTEDGGRGPGAKGQRNQAPEPVETRAPQRRGLAQVLAASRASSQQTAVDLFRAPPPQCHRGDSRTSDSREENPSGGPPKAVVLTEWSLELVNLANGRTIPVVRGVRCDTKGPSNALWRTCEVVRADAPRLLVTKKGKFVELQGPLCRSLAKAVGLSPKLSLIFAGGFPTDCWLKLLSNRISPEANQAEASQAAAGTSAEPEHVGNTEESIKVDAEEPVKVDAKEPVKVDATDDNTGLALVPHPEEPEIDVGNGEWTSAHDDLLTLALSRVRPSALHYWRQVAIIVGKSPEECQENAYGAKERKPRVQKQTRKRALETVEGVADPIEETACLVRTNLPKSDGPRRAQKIRKFLNIRSFGATRDFLKVPAGKLLRGKSRQTVPAVSAGPVALGCPPNETAAEPAECTVPASSEPTADGNATETKPVQANVTTETAAEKAPEQQQECPQSAKKCEKHFAPASDGFGFDMTNSSGQALLSPSSLNFFDSLHTGFTPLAKPEQLARKQIAGSPVSKGPARRLEDAFENEALVLGTAGKSLLDLGDCTWQPKGIDSFICTARARRSKLANQGILVDLRKTARPLRAADLAAKPMLKRAPKLFLKVDVSSAVAAATFDHGSPCSAPDESDDEFAPIACVPKLPKDGDNGAFTLPDDFDYMT